MKTFLQRVDEGLLEELDALAEKRGLSRQKAVDQIIREYASEVWIKHSTRHRIEALSEELGLERSAVVEAAVNLLQEETRR